MQTKINKIGLESILIFIPICEFPLFGRINNKLDLLFSVWKLIALLYCFFKIISNRYHRKCFFDTFHLAFYLMCLWELTCTLVKTPYLVFDFISENLFQYLTVFIVLNYLLNYKNQFTNRFIYIAEYIKLSIWANFVLMIVFKNGVIQSLDSSMHLRANWLFGSKNNVVPFFPLVACILGVDMYLNKRKGIKMVIDYLTILVVILSFSSMGELGFEFLLGSTTLLAEAIIYILLLFIFSYIRKFKLEKLFTFRTISMFSIALMLIIVRISNSTNGIVSYILSLAGKDTRFTGRYSVWNYAIEVIRESPVFGIGLEERIFRTWENPLSLNTTIYSFWLSVAVRFGIIGVLFTLYYFFSAEKYAQRNDKVYQMCCISFLIIMIGGLTSTINIRYWTMITVICYCWNKNSFSRMIV